MAQTAANVLIGACTVSVGDYTTGTATTAMVDVGHTNGPVEWTPAFTNTEVGSEQQMGPVKIVPASQKITVKVPMLETNVSNLRIALRQASGMLATTTSGGNLGIGNAVEQYHRLTFVASGPVGGLARTITFWKAMVEGVGPLVMGKAVPTVAEITFSCLADTTQTTTGTGTSINGLYGKYVDV